MHARLPLHRPSDERTSPEAQTPSAHAQLLALQRSVGNRATARLVSEMQSPTIQRVATQGGTQEDWMKTSSEGYVAKCDKEDFVILVRGCNSVDELMSIVQNDTAGGMTPARKDGEAPSNQQAIAQVAFEGAPWKVSGERQEARRRTNDIEYSTDVATSASFARTGIVQVKIQKKYLVKGSGTENGWICYRDAPVEGLFYMTAKAMQAARQKVGAM